MQRTSPRRENVQRALLSAEAGQTLTSQWGTARSGLPAAH